MGTNIISVEADQAIEYIIEDLGFKNKKEFELSTGFELKRAWTWRDEIALQIVFINPFYRSITHPSIFTVTLKDRKNNIKEYNKKKSYKIRQMSKLEALKQKGIAKIKKFIIESFWIDPKLVKTSDIIFNDNSTFKIGEKIFSYNTIITNNEFKINNYSYSSYANSRLTINMILNYYYKKDISEITNFKIEKE